MSMQGFAWHKAVGGLGVIGAVVFGAAWLYSFIDPVSVESMARAAVLAEVQERVEVRLERLDGTALAGIAARVIGQNSREMDVLGRKLRASVPHQVAAVGAQMLDPDCTCREGVEQLLRDADAHAVADLGRLNERLVALIRTQYMQVATALVREFRIFTGANALLFALLGGLAAFRSKARIQLLVPASILLVAAVFVGTSYLFGQDWLHTILFGEYVGYAYFGHLGLVVGFLADVAVNRARVTTMLLNALFQVAGAAVHVAPC